jgi:hypothetical protein
VTKNKDLGRVKSAAARLVLAIVTVAERRFDPVYLAIAELRRWLLFRIVRDL